MEDQEKLNVEPEAAGVPTESSPEEESLREKSEDTPPESTPDIADAVGAATAETETVAARPEAGVAEAVAPAGAADAGGETTVEASAVEAAVVETPAEAEPEGTAAGGAEEPEGGESAETLPMMDENPNMRWFIIHTYSGFENKVAESLRGRSQAFGFNDKIGQILIPAEEVVEMRAGKKVTSKRLLYPGYVMLQLEMSDDLWHAVKATPRVTGFVGGGSKPVPLSADEVNQIFYRQASSAERPRPKLTYEKGEMVRITEGPFANFQGKVDDVNADRDTLRVLVTIFGRATPVELEFLQVEKI